MQQVLYIVSNPKSLKDSVTLQIGQTFSDHYVQTHPNDVMVELDVYKQEIPLIDQDVLTGWAMRTKGIHINEFPPAIRKKVEKIDRLTEQFIQADRYIFVVPMWNFGIPPMLKAYVDTFKVARKTFQYTPDGPIGLLSNKKAVIIQARGDVYSSGRNVEREHSVSYLSSVLLFIGVEEIHTILAEGMNKFSPEECERIKQSAMEQARCVAEQI